MATKAARIPNMDDPFMIEARAAVVALEFAKDCGFREIVLEGDALSIRKKLQNDDHDLSPLGHIIDEGRLLKGLFSNCSFCHCMRKGNEVAHFLARYGRDRMRDEI
ncbi:hypothetical protein PTKIN_Ptkin03bG0196100 [Pterospermum kingtungense]